MEWHEEGGREERERRGRRREGEESKSWIGKEWGNNGGRGERENVIYECLKCS